MMNEEFLRGMVERLRGAEWQPWPAPSGGTTVMQELNARMMAEPVSVAYRFTIVDHEGGIVAQYDTAGYWVHASQAFAEIADGFGELPVGHTVAVEILPYEEGRL